jgi:hypothetical protein
MHRLAARTAARVNSLRRVQSDIAPTRRAAIQCVMRIPPISLFDVAHALVAADPALGPDAALAAIGPMFDADRVWLMHFDRELTQLWISHEWCADGVQAFLPDFPGTPIGLLALPLIQLRRGRPVVYADIEKLPHDGQALKEEMRREGNRATAGAPIMRDGRIVALIGLDDVRKVRSWSARQMALLGQLGQLVLAAARRQPEARPASLLPPAPVPSGCYVRAGNSHVQVNWPEIVSIKAEGDYTRVRLENGREFLEQKGIAVWESMLPAHYFGRIHRSWIIGWAHLAQLRRSRGRRWMLHLRGQPTELPVGRRYQPAVRLQMNLRPV